MSLDKIFGLYTLGFLGVTILIGIGEMAFGLPNRWIGWIFMGLSLLIYVFIGIVTRTSNADQYYVAGRGVPAIYNGMATGSDWMSAASFISMGGALSAQGFAGLAYVMGWTGGYLLLAVFLGPYLRQFGAYTIPASASSSRASSAWISTSGSSSACWACCSVRSWAVCAR
jgi:cation/acetate symporter